MNGTGALRSPVVWSRLVARVIDAVVFSIVPGTAVGALVLCVLGLMAWDRSVTSGFGEGLLAMSWSLVLIAAWVAVVLPGIVAALFFYEVALPNRRGQTLGKHLMRICIVAAAGEAVGVPRKGRLTLRWLVLQGPVGMVLLASIPDGLLPWSSAVKFAVAAMACVCVAAIPVLFDGRRRGLHDIAGRTVVVGTQRLPEGHPALGPWRWRRARPTRSAAPGSREPGADLPQGAAGAPPDEQREA